MATTLIKNAMLVNEGKIFHADVLIKNNIIQKIDTNGIAMPADNVIDAYGMHMLPGVIDDQVHFREPGLTHKGTIYSEAKAAVAGGITSYMEMPNTNPPAITLQLLEEKYARAAQCSLANYSFYLGASNTNISELLLVDETMVCGVKIFMGSSTGNMLVNDKEALNQIFKTVKTLIAVHCEDDEIIKQNAEQIIAANGNNITAQFHPKIRNEEACYASSSYAVALARKYNTRLHVLHISTSKELALFSNNIPLSKKRITAEACIHHLWFSDEDYATKGNDIKWNPSIKKVSDKEAIMQAVLNDTIDVIATDHAPHTIAEKSLPYLQAPSGGPLVQHALLAMIDLHKQGKISLEVLVKKMCHNVAEMFEIDRRGFIREGYFADLVLVDLNKSHTVNKENILYQCGWSPFDNYTFVATIEHTFVNGNHVYNKGIFDETTMGARLNFNR